MESEKKKSWKLQNNSKVISKTCEKSEIRLWNILEKQFLLIQSGKVKSKKNVRVFV